MRHEAQLRQVSAQINQANEIIRSTKESCKSAAEELAQYWSGDARDAFVAEQVKATSWLEKMIAIIAELSSTIDKVNQTYSNVEQQVSNLIKGK
jgi:WXG100 family type VII secretion target